MKQVCLLAGMLCAACVAFGSQKVGLSGTWKLRQADGDATVYDMTIPGGIHTALLDAKKIPDPFFGRNELDVQWVGQKDWIVERSFHVDASLLSHDSVILRLEHVDTFCEISINGERVGETANYFRRYDFDVKRFLKPGLNTFTALFRSADNKTEELGEKLPYEIPMVNNGIVPHMNLIRKPICHGGWDWGLALMVTGFADEPVLIATDTARIDYVYCDQQHEKDVVKLTVHADVISPNGGDTKMRVSVEETGEVVEGSVTLDPGKNSLSAPIEIENPKLWWPSGAGEQNLYTITVTVGDSSFTRKIGLRTVEVLNKQDQWGTSMSFRINGKDIFCKGANWIPCDAFMNRQTPEKIRDLLQSAKDANMNIVRLWGGGQFESDAFYQICDELGIMIWHDFMFSCALYPATPEFLEEVNAELQHQIRRLRDYASIILWCGDNECIGALGWFEPSRKSRDRYLLNYDHLNQVLAAACRQLDPSRIFWPSSPCGGPGDFGDGWHNDRNGDMHFWEVWHSNKEFAKYYSVKPRFCSEFGFQSFSSREVALKFCKEEDLNPTAPDFEYHQKNVGGNTRILSTMANYFRFPEGTDAVLYLSQVQQAMAIRTAVEAWRHLQPRCMGTIFWQLNDNWPVASWSSIEYGGKWKHLQYHAKRFYAPLAICATPSDFDPNLIEIWAVNDHDETLTCAAHADLWQVDGDRANQRFDLSTELAPRSAKQLKSVRVSEFGNDKERLSRFLALEISAVVNGKREISRNEWVFTKYKTFNLSKADVKVKAAERNGEWMVEVSTDRPAFFVWLNTSVPGEFSDNSFLLLPGQSKLLTFKRKGAGTFDEFQKSLSLMHLRKTYR
ncbi:MAG: glycoside hydrolase family 2 protein [Kiritimatiellae bacterium]|nr:glycoside hydrolase family 2 protein [Kiritimatiellia bacterium]